MEKKTFEQTVKDCIIAGLRFTDVFINEYLKKDDYDASKLFITGLTFGSSIDDVRNYHKNLLEKPIQPKTIYRKRRIVRRRKLIFPPKRDS